jgi:hypothetical protein
MESDKPYNNICTSLEQVWLPYLLPPALSKFISIGVSSVIRSRKQETGIKKQEHFCLP